MAKKVVTISREFGSGGRSVAKMVAELLGYRYYDKELIEKVASKTGFDASYVAEQGEYAPTRSQFAYSFLGRGLNGLAAEDYLWTAQRKIICELADKGSCVIVGRCSDYVLREYPDCFHVFIHANMAYRADRIVRLYGETTDTPFKRLEEKDKKRAINYRYHTGREWGRVQNYHLSVDSGTLGPDACARFIAGLCR